MTRPRQDKCAVYCRHCTLEIEACRGAHGEWMHTTSRREACWPLNHSGHSPLAEPETARQVELAYQSKRRRAS